MYHRHLVPVILAFAALTGCTRMYALPDAPPKSEWVAAKKVEESPEVLMRRFLDAKRAAIQCFAALADKNWAGALSWMSAQTVDFFNSHAKEGSAQSAFETHTLQIDGEEVSFDPVGDVFISDLADIRDEFGSITDDESETRKILYAVDRAGHARKLVFVYEDTRWRLDLSELSQERLTE